MQVKQNQKSKNSKAMSIPKMSITRQNNIAKFRSKMLEIANKRYEIEIKQLKDILRKERSLKRQKRIEEFE